MAALDFPTTDIIAQLYAGPEDGATLATTFHTTEIQLPSGDRYHYSEILTQIHALPTFVWEHSPLMQWTDQ